MEPNSENTPIRQIYLKGIRRLPTDEQERMEHTACHEGIIALHNLERLYQQTASDFPEVESL